jgi:ribonuclease HI
MAKNKYYAVVKGRVPGIYTSWFGPGEAEAQVSGFPGAVFKGFITLSEAEKWMGDLTKSSAEANHLSPKSTQDNSHEPAETITEDDQIIIYTDGGCIGNPGPGGYGAVLLFQNQRKELSGGYRLTTNNRMELMACIAALQSLKVKTSVVLHSDSQYVVRGMMEGWAKRWRSNNWKRTKKEKAENPDLWSQLLDLSEQLDVNYIWVRGHAGIPENERCDELSMEAASNRDLPIDTVYEENMRNKPKPSRFDF